MSGPGVHGRRSPRVALSTPAELLVIKDTEVVFLANLSTRDVSAGGAFVVTKEPLPAGAPVRLHFVLSGCTDPRCRVSVRGWISRTASDGVAVRFDRKVA